MLKKTTFHSFKAIQSSRNLSIALFRGLNLTKHCNAQKIPKFPTLKLTKHCNAQKIQKFQNSGIYGQDSLKVWNFLSITVFREPRLRFET